MDLTVKLVLRAQAEGVSAIKAMREETAELASAMAEVRNAARAGGSVSPGAIKALGGYNEFQAAMVKAQKELATPAVGERSPEELERSFRRDLGYQNTRAKVRLAESARVAKAEAAQAKSTADTEKREAEGVLGFKQRMWAQQAREAQTEAQAEARAAEQAAPAEKRAAEESLRANMAYWRQRGEAARQGEAAEGRQTAAAARERRATLRGMGLGMFAGPTPEGEKEEGHGGGGHGGRGLVSEFKTAAGYTLTYGAINKVMEGVGAVLHSPIDIGRMTLGVASKAREVKELADATRLTTNQVQELQYAFAAKGLNDEKLPQTLLWLSRSEVGAARNIKNNAVAFKALGVSVFDAGHKLKGTQKLLYEVTDALHKMGGGPKADTISQMIFGRGVKDILPLVQGGSAALRAAAGEADKSGFVITPEDLERGEQLASQWSRLKLQLAGVRNTAAVAAMPIVSDLAGEASAYLTTHRAEVTKTIRDDAAELKTDLPVIVSGLKSMADSALAMSRNIGPFVHDLITIGNSPVARYIFSGQILPGGLDLGKPLAAQGEAPRVLYDPETHRPTSAPDPAHLHVTVAADPGTRVTSMRSQGVRATSNRGTIQMAH